MENTCTAAFCGCSARTPDQAMQRTAKFIGVDALKAIALFALLREYGWELTRRED